MNQPHIYPGLFDKRVEFFAYEEEVFCFHNGRTLSYNEFTDQMHLAVLGHMASNPQYVNWVKEKSKRDFSNDFSKRYIYYIFGGLNFKADIELDGTMNACDFYQCDEDVPMILKVNDGKEISKSEIRVLREITHPNKIIADHLFLSTQTVNVHIQNIMPKTGAQSKAELTELALIEGVI